MDAFAPPATHKAIEFDVLWELGEDLMAAGPTLSVEAVDEIAESHDVPRAYAWMALSYAPTVQVERSTDIAIAICCARCQLWGATDRVAELLELRDARLAADRVAFDLVPRGCLNRCSQAPVATAILEDGVVGLAKVTVESVTELLDAVEAELG